MTFLAEFPKEVVDSHALIVADIMAGQPPSTEIFLQLAAEVLAIDKLTVLAARQAGTIQTAHDCWQSAFACFESSLDLINRLPLHDDLLASHRRLLIRLLVNAQDRREFYSVTDHDRLVYNAGRDHGMPVET
jgi:hypothetical protein